MHPERVGRTRPPSIRHEGHHGLSPDLNHDELALLDFQMTSNFFISQAIYPGTKVAWQKRQRPQLEKSLGRKPKHRRELRPFMQTDPMWQVWSSLKRNNQEMSYQIRGDIISRQEEKLQENWTTKKRNIGSLSLDSNLEVPGYIDAVDIHCMPNGYNSDGGEGIFAGANYDTASLYLATGGELGIWNDGAGWANVAFLETNYPDLNPKKILDLGCTVGHSTLPFKEYWPESEVFGIDVCAPVLRYAYGRANSLGFPIHFSQQNAESTNFPDKSFDLIVSTMFLHEIPRQAMTRIGKEIYRLLKPQGLMLHNEQPQYHGQEPDEQFFREWDTWYNNEPMRCSFRDMNLDLWAQRAGFNPRSLMKTMAPGAAKTFQGIEVRNDGFWFIVSATK